MARLPDSNDLGARPVPISRRGVSSNPAAGAVGYAVAGVGADIAQGGQQLLEKQDKLASAAAQSILLKADVTSRAALEHDPDYATARTRYDEQMKTARDSAAAVLPKGQRALFDADADVILARGQAQVEETARGKQITARKSVLYSSLDQLQETARAAPDEATRAAAIKNSNLLFDSAREEGIIDPLTATQGRQEWAGNYAAGQATTALNNENPDSAAEILKTFGHFMPQNVREGLEARLKRVQDGRTQLSDAQWAVTVAGDAATPTGTTAPVAQPSQQAMFGAIVSNEGGTNPDGSFRTSPKGAVGPAQVMPGTGPEAARLAGVPWDDHKYRTDRAYNLKLGQAYFAEQQRTFGDADKAAAAYNAGPGRVRSAIAKAKAAGHPDNWEAYLPEETQKYVKDFRAKSGYAGAEQSPQRHDLDQAYARIDERADKEEWTIERRERAKAGVDDIVQRDELLANRQDAQNMRVATDKVAELGDDFTDVSQVPNYESLSGSDKIQLQNRAEENARRKNAAARDLTNYNTAAATPGFVWNPYDDNQRKAVNAAVAAQDNSIGATFDIWQKTGILATNGAVGLRGGLVSTDPQRVQAAANVAGNMLRRNPNAFAGVEGGDDMERAGLAFNHYVYELGMDPQSAAARIAHENTPEYKNKVKVGDTPELQAYQLQLRRGNADAAGPALGGQFRNAEAAQRANRTLSELTIENMRKGADQNTARSQAIGQMRKMYAPSYDGKLVIYPPELAYPAINGSHGWVYGDAQAAVKQKTGEVSNNIQLLAVPGVTDDDIRAGRPARYRIMYTHMKDGHQVADVLPGLFAADIGKAQRDASAAAHRNLTSTRAKRQQEAIAATPGSDYLSDPYADN